MKNQNDRISWCVLGAVSLCVGSIAPSAIAQDVFETMMYSRSGVSGGFGWAVAVDHSVVGIGAFQGTGIVSNSGMAYLFDVESGEELLELFADDGQSGDRFGRSIAIDQGIVAVSAPFGRAGAAYLFDLETGQQLRKIVPSDGLANDRFGASIAMEDGVLIIGSPWNDLSGASAGAVYLHDVDTGEEIGRLVPEDQASSMNFGNAVSISNGVIAVGAISDDELGLNSGAAYLFDAMSRSQLFKLRAGDPSSLDHFGSSIDINNDLVIVGSPQEVGVGSGSAYLFDVQTGEQIYKLVVDDAINGDRFGASVAIDDHYIVVGGINAEGQALGSGAARLFHTSNGRELSRLLARNGQSNHRFSNSVLISDGVVYVGDNNAGVLYAFERCAVDFTFDNIIDFFDVSAFIRAFIAGDPGADFVEDGVLNFFDIGAFIGIFGNECS